MIAFSFRCNILVLLGICLQGSVGGIAGGVATAVGGVLSTAGGAAAVTTLFGVAGTRMGVIKMSKRTAGLDVFVLYRIQCPEVSPAEPKQIEDAKEASTELAAEKQGEAESTDKKQAEKMTEKADKANKDEAGRKSPPGFASRFFKKATDAAKSLKPGSSKAKEEEEKAKAASEAEAEENEAAGNVPGMSLFIW